VLQHATGGVSGNPNPRNASNQLERPFTEKAMIYPRVRTVTYSIGNDTASGLSALLRNGQPIVTGVENMQIQYGLDPDGDGVVDQYVSANDVADFSAVASIRVGLLVRSPDARNESASGYVFFDASNPVNASSITVEAGDNNLFPSRRVYTQTIAFRNRQPPFGTGP
jgi:type IV pilus assembly protein PilW